MTDAPIAHVESADCPCRPRLEQPCRNCAVESGDGVAVAPRPGCPACKGSGWYAPAVPMPGVPTVVVHNAADGRE